MAIINTPISAKVRLMDEEDKSSLTIADIRTDAEADDVHKFVCGLETLRVPDFGKVYFVVESELEQTV